MTQATLIAAAFTAFSLVACSAADPSTGDTSASELSTKPAASGAAPRDAVIPLPAAAMMPGNLHWTRNSAEFQASTRQAFVLASMQLDAKIASRYSNRGWAVVVDADETILDNSEFQKEGWEQGVSFTPERWSAWVHRKEAKALAGSAAFLKHVHRLGGKIAVVTNRNTDECPDSEANLRNLQLEFDVVLCKSDTSDKNPRFAMVEEGKASPSLPALDVLLYLGDNIQDFPALDQGARGSEAKLADFGSRFIVIPNPMYGSWEKNPQN